MGDESRGGVHVCRSLDTLFQQAACLRPVLQRKMEVYVGASETASRIGGSLQVRCRVWGLGFEILGLKWRLA